MSENSIACRSDEECLTQRRLISVHSDLLVSMDEEYTAVRGVPMSALDNRTNKTLHTVGFDGETLIRTTSHPHRLVETGVEAVLQRNSMVRWVGPRLLNLLDGVLYVSNCSADKISVITEFGTVRARSATFSVTADVVGVEIAVRSGHVEMNSDCGMVTSQNVPQKSVAILSLFPGGMSESFERLDDEQWAVVAEYGASSDS